MKLLSRQKNEPTVVKASNSNKENTCMQLYPFRIHHAFRSEAGPIWICRQVFEKQTEEQIRKNPLLLFWRNDMLRKPSRYGAYTACWVGKGIRCHGIFLILFLSGKTPFLGAYRVHSHLHVFDVDLEPSLIDEFEQQEGNRAQARMHRQNIFNPVKFIDVYGDVTDDMEELPEA